MRLFCFGKFVLAAGLLAMLACAHSRDTVSPVGLPQTGTLLEVQQGDLSCYFILKGEQKPLYASFDLCTQELVGRRVRLHYAPASINDCESIEPCGKTRKVQMVMRIEALP